MIAHISVLFYYSYILYILSFLFPYQIIFMDHGNSQLSQQVPEVFTSTTAFATEHRLYGPKFWMNTTGKHHNTIILLPHQEH